MAKSYEERYQGWSLDAVGRDLDRRQKVANRMILWGLVGTAVAPPATFVLAAWLTHTWGF